MKDCFPTFLLIGAEKAGTTWLDLCLRSHSQCFMAETKEVAFFNKYDSNLDVSDTFSKRGIDWYQSFFRNAGEAHVARGESTPLYLSDPLAAKRIAATIPDVKLVAILRDPVTRAYSHYRMISHKNNISSDVQTLLDAGDLRIVERGRYVRHLRRFADLFPREQIHLIVSEHISAAPEEHLAQLGIFLSVEPDGFSIVPSANAAAAHRSAALNNLGVQLARRLWMSPVTVPIARRLKRSGFYALVKRANTKSPRALPLGRNERIRLAELYAEDNERLAAEFGVDTSTWTTPDSTPVTV